MYYKIADLIVDMNPQYAPLINQIAPYKIDDVPEVVHCVISQGNKTITEQNKKYPRLSRGEVEYLLYGAYFYDALLKYQGILLHSSCVIYQGVAYLFSANSGVGKSTHTSIWCRIFPEAFILNDDKPALRFDEDRLYAYGTPFSGKTNQNVNARYPVAGIAFIHRSDINKSEPISTKQALVRFMQQTLKPHDESRFDLIVQTLECILKTTRFYSLGVNMSDEAALMAYDTMRQDR
ncbi:MAG: hypothetical protein PHY42_00810 [Bacilli bacterium]|nr:hypothetical protein [Bacilli bacterium]